MNGHFSVTNAGRKRTHGTHFPPLPLSIIPSPEKSFSALRRALLPMSQKPSSPSPSPTPFRQPLRRSLVSYQFMHGHYNITTPRHELIRSLVPSPPPPLSLSPLVPRSSPPLFRRCFRRPALLHPPPRFQSPMRRRCRRPIPLLWNLSRPPFSLVFVSILFGICLAPPFSFAFCHVFPLLSLVFVPFPLGFCHALTWILSHFTILPPCLSTTYPSPYSIYSLIF